MGINRRRVVTGHDGAGNSRVIIDERVVDIVSSRPGSLSSVIWANSAFPADNVHSHSVASADVGKILPDGVVFRIVRYEPGAEPRMHRTTSIDYAVVLSGRIALILDEGEVLLEAGDFVVQRGTMHGWRNTGPEACEIAFVLVAAEPVRTADTELDNVGW